MCPAMRRSPRGDPGDSGDSVDSGILAAQNLVGGIDGELLTGSGIFANQKSAEQLKVLDIWGVQ